MHRIVKCLPIVFILIFILTGCAGKKNDNIANGVAAVEALNYDEALTSFQFAIDAGENLREAYRGQGIAYMGKTMYTEAVESFETALKQSNGIINDMDIDMNYYLATAYFKQKDYDNAIQIYNAIIALRKNEKDALYFRGVAYADKGELDRAKASFDDAIALEPEGYDRLIDIYGVLSANGYKEVGEEYLQKAMDAGTKKMTNYEKGRISFYLGDFDNARTYLEKARDEEGYRAVLFLGKTYETLGDNNYAISVYNTYLEGKEQNPEVLNQLGLCKMRIGDYEGALLAFQSAMKIENNGMMQTLKMNEIISYERLMDFKKASVLLESYLKTYPDDEEAKREDIFLKTR